MTKDPDAGRCACSVVHEGAVAKARAAELPTASLLAVSELLKLLGDPTRLRIVGALSAAGELCVCDLSAALDMSQSAISHQLAMLRRARLVRYRRDGKSAVYALDDGHVGELLAVATAHADEGKE